MVVSCLRLLPDTVKIRVDRFTLERDLVTEDNAILAGMKRLLGSDDDDDGGLEMGKK